MKVEDIKEIFDILSAAYLFYTEETDNMKECEKILKEKMDLLKKELDEKQYKILKIIGDIHEDCVCAAMKFAFMQGMKVNNENFSIKFALCCERDEPLDVPTYAFGQGASPFVSFVLHYFSKAPRGCCKTQRVLQQSHMFTLL